MAENIIINVKVDGEQQLKRVENQVGNLGKTTNKTQNELYKLRAGLRDAKADMIKAGKGTEEYNRALARASDLQSKVSTMNQKVRLSTLDFGTTARNVAKSVSVLAAGFGVLQGTIALLGIENEDTIRSIQKLQAVMAITQGIAQFSSAMSGARSGATQLNIAFRDSSEGANKASDSIDRVGDSMDNMASKSSHMASNLAGAAKTTDNLDKSFSGLTERLGVLSKAQKEALEDYFYLKEELEEVLEVQKEYNTLSEEYNNISDYTSKRAEELEEELDNLNNAWGNLDDEVKKAEKNLTDAEQAFKNLSKGTDDAAKSTGKFGTAIKKLGTGITKTAKTIAISLGYMAAFAAALWLITKGIEALVKWINKIPTHVKIELELHESVVKDSEKHFITIAKIRHNITLASNKEELDLLKKKLIDEKIATEDELKGLNDSKALLNAEFWDNYLENVKIVAKNEALIRKDIEFQLQKDLLNARINTLTREGRLQKRDGKKALKERKELNKEFNEFKKAFYNEDGTLKLEPLAFDLGLKGGSGGATAITKATKDMAELRYQTQLLEDELKNLFDIGLSGKQSIDLDLNLSVGDLGDLAVVRGELTKAALPGEDIDYIQVELDVINEMYGKGYMDYKTYLERMVKVLKWAEDERRDMSDTSYFVEKEKQQRMIEQYISYTNALEGVSNGISSIYSARMTEIDNYYNAEARLIEQSVMNEEARNEALYQLEWERYEAQKEVFEKMKKFEEAGVWINLASGLMGVYANAVKPDRLSGPLAWVQAGLETAALTAQAIGSVKAIRAQTLEAPSRMGSSSGASMPSVALNPTQTALTSKEENLNIMNRASNVDNQPVIVKVSEINNVQNKVGVRESNSVY